MSMANRVASRHLFRQATFSKEADDGFAKIIKGAADDLDKVNAMLKDIVDVLDGPEGEAPSDVYGPVSEVVNKLRRTISKEIGDMADSLRRVKASKTAKAVALGKAQKKGLKILLKEDLWWDNPKITNRTLSALSKKKLIEAVDEKTVGNITKYLYRITEAGKAKAKELGLDEDKGGKTGFVHPALGRVHPALLTGSRSMSAAAQTPNKIDPRLKARIAQAMTRAGLDGNGRFRKPELALAAALDVLGEFGIEPDEVVSSHLFNRDEGRVTVQLAFTNQADSFSPISITNSVLALSWTKLGEDRFEGLAYLS